MADKNRPRRRRGRPLLVAGAGLAAALGVHCSSTPAPMGNLKAPDCDMDVAGLCPKPDLAPAPDQIVVPVDAGVDQAQPDGPMGNLKPPADGAAPSDLLDGGGDADVDLAAPDAPMGNLKPPMDMK